MCLQRNLETYMYAQEKNAWSENIWEDLKLSDTTQADHYAKCRPD